MSPKTSERNAPPPLSAEEKRQALSEAVRQFNSWRFYDCHETLEDVWRAERGDLADFYQGIIKVAAGFHHLLRGNHKGTLNLLGHALTLLDPYRPQRQGVNVDRLADTISACLEDVKRLGPQRLSEFDRSRIPRIETHSLERPPMTPRERSVQADDVRLHCLEWGHGGPPIVFLHATGFLARLWQPIAEPLARRFHVYAYDARGHGDSDKPAEGYDWQRFVVDFKAFLDALDLRGVIAVGHSIGGATVARLAATEPGYIAAAVLIEPIIFPPEPDGSPNPLKLQMVEGAANRRMVWTSPDALARSYRKRPAFARWREDVLRLYAEHGTFRRPDGRHELKCPGKIEAKVFAGGPSPETWDLVPDIRCPVLVMRGERTESHLGWAATHTAERIPEARLIAIPESGHFPPMERPQAVAEEISRFVDLLGVHA